MDYIIKNYILEAKKRIVEEKKVFFELNHSDIKKAKELANELNSYTKKIKLFGMKFNVDFSNDKECDLFIVAEVI